MAPTPPAAAAAAAPRPAPSTATVQLPPCFGSDYGSDDGDDGVCTTTAADIEPTPADVCRFLSALNARLESDGCTPSALLPGEDAPARAVRCWPTALLPLAHLPLLRRHQKRRADGDTWCRFEETEAARRAKRRRADVEGRVCGEDDSDNDDESVVSLADTYDSLCSDDIRAADPDVGRWADGLHAGGGGGGGRGSVQAAVQGGRWDLRCAWDEFCWYLMPGAPAPLLLPVVSSPSSARSPERLLRATQGCAAAPPLVGAGVAQTLRAACGGGLDAGAEAAVRAADWDAERLGLLGWVLHAPQVEVVRYAVLARCLAAREGEEEAMPLREAGVASNPMLPQCGAGGALSLDGPLSGAMGLGQSLDGGAGSGGAAFGRVRARWEERQAASLWATELEAALSVCVSRARAFDAARWQAWVASCEAAASVLVHDTVRGVAAAEAAGSQGAASGVGHEPTQAWAAARGGANRARVWEVLAFRTGGGQRGGPCSREAALDFDGAYAAYTQWAAAREEVAAAAAAAAAAGKKSPPADAPPERDATPLNVDDVVASCLRRVTWGGGEDAGDGDAVSLEGSWRPATAAAASCLCGVLCRHNTRCAASVCLRAGAPVWRLEVDAATGAVRVASTACGVEYAGRVPPLVPPQEEGAAPAPAGAASAPSEEEVEGVVSLALEQTVGVVVGRTASAVEAGLAAAGSACAVLRLMCPVARGWTAASLVREDFSTLPTQQPPAAAGFAAAMTAAAAWHTFPLAAKVERVRRLDVHGVPTVTDRPAWAPFPMLNPPVPPHAVLAAEEGCGRSRCAEAAGGAAAVEDALQRHAAQVAWWRRSGVSAVAADGLRRHNHPLCDCGVAARDDVCMLREAALQTLLYGEAQAARAMQVLADVGASPVQGRAAVADASAVLLTLVAAAVAAGKVCAGPAKEEEEAEAAAKKGDMVVLTDVGAEAVLLRSVQRAATRAADAAAPALVLPGVVAVAAAARRLRQERSSAVAGFVFVEAGAALVVTAVPGSGAGSTATVSVAQQAAAKRARVSFDVYPGDFRREG